MKASNIAYCYGLGAVLLWSTVATSFKIALSYYSPMQLVFVASITSIFILTILLSIQKKCHLIGRQFTSKPFFYIQTGLLNPFLYYLALFKAYDVLPAQQALALNYTWAILLPLLAVPLLKQQLKLKDLIAAAVGYVGVLIIATNGQITQMHFDDATGVAFALVSTLFWCLYWIINTKDEGDPIVSLLLSFLVSSPFIITLLLLTNGFPVFDVKAMAAGIYVGLFEMGITFVLWLMALKTSTRTANISTLAFLTPLLSMVFIAVILKEAITHTTLIGMGLIIAALAIQRLKKTHCL